MLITHIYIDNKSSFQFKIYALKSTLSNTTHTNSEQSCSTLFQSRLWHVKNLYFTNAKKQVVLYGRMLLYAFTTLFKKVDK